MTIFFNLVLFLIFYLNLIILLIEDPLLLGLMVLLKTFFVTYFSSFVFSSWLALIFFLIYIGGILVLIFYSLTLKSNPFSSWVIKPYWILFSLFISLCWVWGLSSSSFFENWELMNLNLWSNEEMSFIMGILSFLLVVLWFITKLIFNVSGAFRPVF